MFKASNRGARPLRTEDRLGFGKLVTPLIARIAGRTSEDPPLTVGVFGEWGTGKTRFLRLIEQELKDKRIPVVWFNAWRYANEEHLWVALLQRVMDQLESASGWIVRPFVRLRLSLMQTDLSGGLRHLLWRVVVFLLRLGVVLGLLVFVFTANQPAIEQLLRTLTGTPTSPWQLTTVKVLLVLAAVLATKPKDLFDILRGASIGIDLSKYLEKVPYRDRVAFLDELGPFFRRVVAAAGGGKSVVVLIDDLDRCLPDKAIQVLEAMALFLDVEGCVFILAADRRMLEEAITVRYKDLAAANLPGGRAVRIGEGYFDKIVQLSIGIPPISDQRFESFLQQLIEEDELSRCVPILMKSLPRNARKCERFLGTLGLSFASRREAEEKNIVTSLLVKIVALQDVHPPLFDMLRERPDLLGIAEQHYAKTLDGGSEGSLLATLDEIAVLKPAVRHVLSVHIDDDDSFIDVEIAPYIYLLDPVLTAREGEAVIAATANDDVELSLRRYLSVFVRRYEVVVMPFSSGEKLALTSLPILMLYARGSQRPESRSMAEIVDTDTHVVVLGAPGSGKTTLLRQIGVQVAAAGTHVPILIAFRELSAAIGTQPAAGAAVDLLFVLEKYFRRFEMPLDATAIRTLLESGRAMLLLDGLDEVLEHERPRLVEAVLALEARYPRVPVVVTSRLVAYRLLGGRFREYVIAELDPIAQDRITELILHTSGFPDSAIAGFKERLSRSPYLREIARTPLMTTMLAVIYGASDTLPEDRLAAMRQAVDLLLERWDRSRGVATEIAGEPSRAVLEALAGEVIRTGEAVFTDDMIAAAVRPLGLGIDASVVVRALVERSGLLVEITPGSYQFVHRAFFEFFAAHWVVRSGPATSVELAHLARAEEFAGVVRDVLLLLPDDNVACELVSKLASEASPWLIDELVGVAIARCGPEQRATLAGELQERKEELDGIDRARVMAAIVRLREV